MKQMCGGVLAVVLLVSQILSQTVWAQFEPDTPVSSVSPTIDDAVSPAIGSTVPATVSPATGSTVSPALGPTVPATVSPANHSTVSASVSSTIAGSVTSSTFDSTSGSTSRRVAGYPVLLLSLILVGPVFYDWSL